MSTLFEEAGGEWAVREVIHNFVDEVMADSMVGFFFQNTDPARLREKEYEFTARFLGAQVNYTGKGLRAAHMRFPIMGGQFERRKQILKECLTKARIPGQVSRAWLSHVDQMRHLITRDAQGECQAPTWPASSPLKK